MNKKVLQLIIFPLLVLISCNKSTSEDLSKYLLTYEDFKNVIKEKDYKSLIKDGTYHYSESVISDNRNTTPSMYSDLTFFDAFKGECTSFYADSYTSTNDVKIFEKWLYDGEYFNYLNSSEGHSTKLVGKYGKSVNFDYRFNLKSFYQLFVDGEFEDVALLDYEKGFQLYWVSFKEQTYFNQTRVEENTNIYLDRDDFSFNQIIQTTSFYEEGKLEKMETKILELKKSNFSNAMDKSSNDYIDLSESCLPNVEF